MKRLFKKDGSGEESVTQRLLGICLPVLKVELRRFSRQRRPKNMRDRIFSKVKQVLEGLEGPTGARTLIACM